MDRKPDDHPYGPDVEWDGYDFESHWNGDARSGSSPNDKTRRGARFCSIAEVNVPTANNALVERIIFPQTDIMLYADYGVGKTAVSLDLACSIACGTPFVGHYETRQGAVLYLGLEGPLGMRARMMALRQERNIPKDAPLFLVEYPLDLRDPASVAQLLRDIDLHRKEYRGQDLSMIVFDTLTRAIPGSAQSTPEDGSTVLCAMARIREATGACAMAVHHRGKSRERGALGTITIPSGMDTVLLIDGTKGQDDPMRVILEKQRDGEDGWCICSYRLRQVQIGTYDDGKPMDSVVVDAEIGGAKRTRPARDTLKGGKFFLLNHFDQLVADEICTTFNNRHGLPDGVPCVALEDLIGRAMKKLDVSDTDDPKQKRKAIKDRIRELHKIGWMDSFDDFVWVLRD